MREKVNVIISSTVAGAIQDRLHSLQGLTSRLLDLSLMQINGVAAQFRAIGRNVYRFTLFAPRPMMLDARKNWSAVDGCRYILIAMSNKLP
ncbi:MAG TPA: hypothetical protein VNR65_00600, partial [Geobacterales bacterium]|nr:hypothetical protein [Geobacterales bacterium]